MNKTQLELLREYVRAEIALAFANNATGADGYGYTPITERKEAEEGFAALVSGLCAEQEFIAERA